MTRKPKQPSRVSKTHKTSRTAKTSRSLEPTIDSNFIIRKITPMNQIQQDVFDSFNEGYQLVLCGDAGTGKTFISLYLALSDIIKNKSKSGPKKILIIRSTVSTRDVGFLPGTLTEKNSVYETAYKGIICELFNRGDAYNILRESGIIDFASTSFLRGSTINDTYIICDEFQNCNFHELDTVISRVGKNCQLIFCGDVVQTDLLKSKYDTTGLPEFLRIIERMDEFEIIEFGIEDCVRSGLVKSYLIAKSQIENLKYLNNK